MNRCAALAALALLAGTACDEGIVSPDAAVVGSYELESFNGHDLPYTVLVTSAARIEIVGGGLELNRNRTFSVSWTSRQTEATQVSTSDIATDGTWSVQGSELMLQEADGDTGTGIVMGDTISVGISGSALVFTR